MRNTLKKCFIWRLSVIGLSDRPTCHLFRWTSIRYV